ncbi:MAG: hypothetical protein CDV28_1703 [Candidatus Electronema aureum]|uniref:Uncharacterized protein n=1 Tax=Candidatus Electronema aureum TaxID=2005002 RepID=A0A521FY56_9BACT|nr:MAG: hypothetical protein CDV28_1703 [Candidatus Electronema aureum]
MCHNTMPSTNLLTTSTSLQKAIAWIGETMQQHPDRQPAEVIAEAELRFDLTPLECEFLHRQFCQADY